MRLFNIITKNRYSLFLLLALLNLALYYETLFYEFVWDDLVHLDYFIENIKGFTDLLNFFFGPNVIGQPHYYRPLMLVSFGIDYLIYKENPLGYHLTCLILHFLNVIFVFIITERIVKDRWVAFLSAVFFTINPVHSEAVVWISARADLLCTLFTLLSLLLYIEVSEKGKRLDLILCLFFYSLAILSKEIALLIPVCFFVYDFYFKKSYSYQKVLYLFSILITIAYLLIRKEIVPVPFGDSFPLIYKIATIPLIFIKYLELFFLPIELKILYDEPKIHTFLSLPSIVGWGLIIFYFLLIYYFYIKNKALSFFLIIYILFLLPVLGVITFIKVSLVGDRYLYLPSFGLVAFFGYLFVLVYRRFRSKVLNFFFITLLITVVFLLFAKSYERNKDWSNQLNLLTKMRENLPNYMPVYLHLGRFYLLKKDYENSIYNYLLAEKLSPEVDKHVVHFNLGYVYTDIGDLERAEEHYLVSLKYNEDFLGSYYNLGLLYFEYKEYKKCHDLLEKALEKFKNKPDLYNLAGLCAVFVGEREKALNYINKAIELNPSKKEEYYKNINLINSMFGN